MTARDRIIQSSFQLSATTYRNGDKPRRLPALAGVGFIARLAAEGCYLCCRLLEAAISTAAFRAFAQVLWASSHVGARATFGATSGQVP